MVEEKVACRTPKRGRVGVTNYPKWKFDVLRREILDAVGSAGADGLAFADLAAQVAARLGDETRTGLGSLGWHVTTVKTELEVRGEIVRLPGVTPQRLITG